MWHWLRMKWPEGPGKCRQEGKLHWQDEVDGTAITAIDPSASAAAQSIFVGFAAYKYKAGFSLLPTLTDAFKPVSTTFRIVNNNDDPVPRPTPFEYVDFVEGCAAKCNRAGLQLYERLDAYENYVGVSVPTVPAAAFKKGWEALNIAPFLS